MGPWIGFTNNWGRIGPRTGCQQREAAEQPWQQLNVNGTVCPMGKAKDLEQMVAMRDQGDTKRALEYRGRVDFLFCSAPGQPSGGEMPGAIEQIPNVNVKALVLLLSQLLRHVENRGYGCREGAVTLVSSSSCHMWSWRPTVLGLTRTLELELVPKDTWVDYFIPGVIKTDFGKVERTELPPMFRALSWTLRGLHCSSIPLSTRMFSERADKSRSLADKVAVITGSTKGIGFAIARHLAQNGAHVVICSRKQWNVDQAVTTLQKEGLSVTGTVCHVGKAEDRDRLVAKALEHHKGIDFLVCVAGVNPLVGSTLGASEQVWDKILGVNVKAPALLLGQLLPHMENRGGGSVVLVSSVAAYMPISKLGVYNTSKTALLGLCKSLAVELAPKGIRVNSIVPGIIKTDFIQMEKTLSYTPSDLNKIYGLQRLGEPEDCAGIVSFLCSSDASYITGENITVAGYSPKL
ncbi:dehydrogenase/reductase SDR family member 2, mitochondrial-like [Marmota monax]|nr:dehydrogenase/reductase SDR family member 2, mitochondrial-like [Marmota monax]